MTKEAQVDGETKPNPYPDEEKALNAALAKAQGEFPPIPKTKKADAGTYSYPYADLAFVIAAVRPVLAKHGLSVIQPLENPSGGRPSIRTELRHVDGGRIRSSFPLGEWSTEQQLGSMQTYRRRYAYCAILGIAPEDEDDDAQNVAPVPGAATGAGASPRPDTGVTESQGPSQSQFVPPQLEEGLHAEEDLTAAQRRKIFAVRTKLIDAGLFSEDDFKAQLVMSFGVDSVTGLSKEQASDLIDRLLKKEEELV